MAKRREQKLNRIIWIALGMITLGLTACGSDSDTGTTDDPSSAGTGDTTQPPPPGAPAAGTGGDQTPPPQAGVGGEQTPPPQAGVGGDQTPPPQAGVGGEQTPPPQAGVGGSDDSGCPGGTACVTNALINGFLGGQGVGGEFYFCGEEGLIALPAACEACPDPSQCQDVQPLGNFCIIPCQR